MKEKKVVLALQSDLLKRVSQELNITRSPSENKLIWQRRLLYSIAGRWALASLWDRKTNKSESVSVEHFKDKIKSLFHACFLLYPDTVPEQSIETFEEFYANEIYERYRQTGYFYYASGALQSAIQSCSQYQQIQFLRGIAPGEECMMSGLGLYRIRTSHGNNSQSIENHFFLQQMSLSQWFTRLLQQHRSWEVFTAPEGTQYLRTKSPFFHGYWQENADKDEKISLARYGEHDQIYSLYRWQKGRFWHSELPLWRTASGEYLRIAAAILQERGSLPKMIIQQDGVLIKLKIQYKLPPAEENFLKLCSWPVSFCCKDENFVRVISSDIYPLIKKTMANLAYQVKEE